MLMWEHNFSHLLLKQLPCCVLIKSHKSIKRVLAFFFYSALFNGKLAQMVVQFAYSRHVNPVLQNSPVALEPKICFLGRSVISYLCTGMP